MNVLDNLQSRCSGAANGVESGGLPQSIEPISLQAIV